MDDHLGFGNGTQDLVALPNGTVVSIHGPAACEGSPCTFHHPSDHPLANNPVVWNPFLKLMFRRCGHDVLHPDPDSLDFMRATGWVDEVLHACCVDGCCLTT